jgi:hypothetical protein
MRPLILLLLSFFILPTQAQNELEYAFDQARAQLAQRQIEEAISSLRKVYIADSENANINFLMGAAYTELPGTQEEAIFHLKKAVQTVNEKYKVGSFKEQGAPIHVYYYLAVALVEQDLCAQANKAYEQFKLYKNKVDSYFIDELGRHLEKCPFEDEEDAKSWNSVEAPPANYNPLEVEKEAEIMQLDSAAIAERGLVTQRLEYTTNAPLYGVQIGSNLTPSPTSRFGKVKNVDVFIDNEGIIRYVVGHFAYRQQAEALLNTLKEKGYADAFVVNVNDKRKYSNEVISYRNINLRSGITGSVEYYIQLGAFQDSIPQHLLNMYLEIDGIQEMKQKEMTLLLVGAFSTYKESLDRKESIARKLEDKPFIVAYNRGKRIPLDEAIKYTESEK